MDQRCENFGNVGKLFRQWYSKKTAVYEWLERFKSGRECPLSRMTNAVADRRHRKPTKTSIKWEKVLINNRKLTIRELAEDLNIAYGSIQDIVVNGLGLRRVAAKLVPKELNFMQKRDCIVIAKDMISKAESDPTFTTLIIIGDET